jgi:UDP-N-acetylmuramate: L-alanyl-gamma-D-glutamyl-meso-diaminopimelate ligase
MKVYFLGIAGAGMSALATLMASEGHEVLGSDGAAYPPVSDHLERLGIPFHCGFAADEIPGDLDLAIVGSSAALDLERNPELAELKARSVPTTSFAEWLGGYSATRRACVVAGSFGKSTLTALIAFIMRSAGRDPGYFIGAVPLDLPTAGHAGRDPELILEGDEYVVSAEDRRS